MEIINLPSYLNKSIVNSWINEVDLWLKTILQSEYDPTFFSLLNSDKYTLEFSEELIKEDNGGISLKEAKQIILKRWPLRPDGYIDKYIEEVIRRIEEARSVEELRSFASQIAEMYTDENGNHDYQGTMGQIHEVLSGVINLGSSNRYLVLGRYYHSTKTVVLYEKAIKKSHKTIPFCLFEETFAHELFHAYHYFICEKKRGYGTTDIVERTDYTSKVVKESLAAYFEFYYCKNNHIYTNIDSDWANTSAAVYPYSGAKHILQQGYQSQFFFTQVLKQSYYDFDLALRTLLENDVDDFYSVKNHKETKTIVINKRKTSHTFVNVAIPIDDMQIEAWLKNMGRGWFILKYAEDQGLPSPIRLDYGPIDSVNTREQTYRRTKQYHKDIIKYLKRKRLFYMTRVRDGTQTVGAKQLQVILDKLN